MRRTATTSIPRGPAAWLWALAATLWCGAAGFGAEPANVVHDLTPLHDAQRVLINPHTGRYHHYPDNRVPHHPPIPISARNRSTP